MTTTKAQMQLDNTTIVTATKEQVRSAVQFVCVLAEAIREAGEIPAGHLYAMVMSRCDLSTFESFLSRLYGANLVERRGDVLVWIGPTMEAS